MRFHTTHHIYKFALRKKVFENIFFIEKSPVQPLFLWYTTDFNMIAAYLSVIEAAGNMPQTRDRPSSSSDNQCKLAAAKHNG